MPSTTGRRDSVDTAAAAGASVAAAETVTMSRGQILIAKATRGLHKCRTLMKDSPLTVIGLKAKQTPKISEIVEQAKILCEDYIFSHMIRTGELPGSREAVELGDAIKLSDVSLEIHLIGSRLEMTYPQLYKNISRNINMPFKNDLSVRRAVISIGDFLFKHGVVTWARIVALFAVAGAIAHECVTTGQSGLVPIIVEQFTDVISRHAAPWICAQGGWAEIMKAFRLNQTTRTLWILSGFGVVTGFIFTWLTASQI